jgi:hypothetical protein
MKRLPANAGETMEDLIWTPDIRRVRNVLGFTQLPDIVLRAQMESRGTGILILKRDLLMPQGFLLLV